MVKTTEAAAEQIKKLIEDDGRENIIGVRLAAKAGGCAGMMYDLQLLEETLEGDKRFEEHGVVIYMDPKSYLFLHNVTVDYTKSMMGQAFTFDVPGAGGCGCGVSFTPPEGE